jgi:hypothetical protein
MSPYESQLRTPQRAQVSVQTDASLMWRHCHTSEQTSTDREFRSPCSFTATLLTHYCPSLPETILPHNFHSRIAKEKTYLFLVSFLFIFPFSMFLSSCLPLACSRYTPVPSAISHLPVCATVLNLIAILAPTITSRVCGKYAKAPPNIFILYYIPRSQVFQYS